MFSQLLDNIDDETIELVYKLQISRPQQDQDRLRRQQQQMETKHDDAAGMATRMAAVSEPVSAGVGGGGGSQAMADAASASRGEKRQPTVRTAPKLGRNDPCHCGSGKKYKKCHGVGA